MSQQQNPTNGMGGLNSASGEFNPNNAFSGKPMFFSSKKQNSQADDPSFKIERNNKSDAPATTVPAPTIAVNVPKQPAPEVFQAAPVTQAPAQARVPQNQQAPGRNEDSDGEVSLTREIERAAALPSYKPPNGDFENFPQINAKTIEKLQRKDIVSLFPIQQNCFYPIYNREDIIARDLTGSGKTLAFALPVTEYLRKNGFLSSRRTQAIVLTPTRELAIQVSKVFQEIKHNPMEYTCATVYGGVSIDEQTHQLKNGCEIFVGTTGRVLDHLNRGNIDFTAIKTVILDEADQMLKLGFKEDIEEILRFVKRQCKDDLQVCLFSATIPGWVRSVANYHMKQNARIIDLVLDLKNKTAKKVQHLAISCPFQNRLSALADVLICYGGQGKTIVFTQTKADANALILTDKIKQDIEVMHGDIAQNQREVTMKRFKEGKFKVLVATDVASRGLDIPNVDLVIQIEPPKEVETYIHRSGRTARAGASGVCITFYTAKTKYLIEDIERNAGIKLQRVGIPQPEDVIRASAKDILNNLQNVNNDVLPMFRDVAKELIETCKGDAEKALCQTLAYISGHYKSAIVARSLLTGQEKLLTLAMRSSQENGKLTVTNCRQYLDRWWGGRTADNIRVIKGIKNSMGALFDIYEDQYDRFMDNFDHIYLQEGDRLEFAVDRCQELPELLEDDVSSSGQGWRNDNDSDYRGNGGNGGGQYGNSGGYNQGGRGGGRGSRGGGYQQQDSYNGGGRGGGRGTRGGYVSKGDDYQPRMMQSQSQQQAYEPESMSNWRTQGNDNFESENSGGFRGNRGNRGGYEPQSDRGGGRGFRGGQSNQYQSRDNNQGQDRGGQGFYRGGDSRGGGAPQMQYKQKSYDERRGDDNSDGQQQPPSSVFITNLPAHYTDKSMQDIFRDGGLKSVKAKLLLDDQGKSKCAGFVEFGSNKEAQDAVKHANNMNVDGGKRLNVQLAKK